MKANKVALSAPIKKKKTKKNKKAIEKKAKPVAAKAVTKAAPKAVVKAVAKVEKKPKIAKAEKAKSQPKVNVNALADVLTADDDATVDPMWKSVIRYPDDKIDEIRRIAKDEGMSINSLVGTWFDILRTKEKARALLSRHKARAQAAVQAQAS